MPAQGHMLTPRDGRETIFLKDRKANCRCVRAYRIPLFRMAYDALEMRSHGGWFTAPPSDPKRGAPMITLNNGYLRNIVTMAASSRAADTDLGGLVSGAIYRTADR
ncbi:hypothetical protein SAMD00023353_3000480 [Rosellinia necatrix]|uniref:Uncharacterized protein n=1 Tax=Rosellinia necatrix TaxID=77044 RepID=A0A1S8A8U3_ROSNE|nr:hypothetical protein SAMD00023353_3000480 [Rosellinia necatrix]